MRPKYLLDSSAVLAVFQEERGADKVAAMLDDAAIHPIQVAEVVKKFMDYGFSANECIQWMEELDLPVIGTTFGTGEAFETARFCVKGLSLGDRICLMAAGREGMTAVTADHAWKKAMDGNPNLKLKVLLIR